MPVRREKAAGGITENSERRRGACTQTLDLKLIIDLEIIDLPGKRRLHRKGRLYVCRERDLLGLSAEEYISLLTPHTIPRFNGSTDVS